MMTDQLLVLEAHLSVSVVHPVSPSVWLINDNPEGSEIAQGYRTHVKEH